MIPCSLVDRYQRFEERVDSIFRVAEETDDKGYKSSPESFIPILQATRLHIPEESRFNVLISDIRTSGLSKCLL